MVLRVKTIPMLVSVCMRTPARYDGWICPPCRDGVFDFGALKSFQRSYQNTLEAIQLLEASSDEDPAEGPCRRASLSAAEV